MGLEAEKSIPDLFKIPVSVPALNSRNLDVPGFGDLPKGLRGRVTGSRTEARNSSQQREIKGSTTAQGQPEEMLWAVSQTEAVVPSAPTACSRISLPKETGNI